MGSNEKACGANAAFLRARNSGCWSEGPSQATRPTTPWGFAAKNRTRFVKILGVPPPTPPKPSGRTGSGYFQNESLSGPGTTFLSNHSRCHSRSADQPQRGFKTDFPSTMEMDGNGDPIVLMMLRYLERTGAPLTGALSAQLGASFVLEPQPAGL